MTAEAEKNCAHLPGPNRCSRPVLMRASAWLALMRPEAWPCDWLYSGAGMKPWSAVSTTMYWSRPTVRSRSWKKACSRRSSCSMWSCDSRDSALKAWFT